MKKSDSICTPANLKRGMKAFLEHKDWPRDFHVEFYCKLRKWQQDGLTQDWWDKIIDELGHWKAIRPKSPGDIRKVAKKRKSLDRMKESLSGIHAKDIASCDWNDIAGLFAVAHKIKETKSESFVFASKLCHFILPKVFPTYDKGALQFPRPSYEAYWQYCQEQWKNCTDKKELKQLLRQKIMQNPDIKASYLKEYPWVAKITELCIMGRK